jgi:hypothetical protein
VTVTNESAGKITNVGGYAGGTPSNYSEAQFEQIKAEGNVTVTASSLSSGTERIGGAFGNIGIEAQLVNVTSKGAVTVVNGHSVGGLIGVSNGMTQIIDSSSTSNVTVSFDGEAKTGGFIGYTRDSSFGDIEISRSWSSGSVTATSMTDGQPSTAVGGFIGYADSVLALRDVYTRSNVSGTSYVGGLIGDSRYSVVDAKNVYVANTVTATATGAVVDAVSNGAFVNSMAVNVYNSTLAGSLANKANFIGKSTSEMKTLATFTAMGWTFDGDKPVWKIAATANDGYPTLVPRPSRGTTVEKIVEVPAAPAAAAPAAPAAPAALAPAAPAKCVAPALLSISFSDGSSKLTAKGLRQVKSFVKKVKASNCTTVGLSAFYVKNSPLAKTRNTVLVRALKNEFWRQKYAVSLKTSIRATTGANERTVRVSVRR